MVPEFLTTMLELFDRCPEAGIAASDVTLTNRSGGKLTEKELAEYLPPESIASLLSLDKVRSYPMKCSVNYRPAPHDCLLHFSTKSVYFSLTQLVIRTALARSIEPFDTTVGSIADLGWLVRLTNRAGTVHIPRKLATWRFRGDQVSIRPDAMRLSRIQKMFEFALPEIYERQQQLLTRSECAALMLPVKAYLATSKKARRRVRVEARIRILWMFLRKPGATVRAMRSTAFSVKTLKETLLPMFVARLGLAPRDIDLETISRVIQRETGLHANALHQAEL
jgi:hypothetical protein